MALDFSKTNGLLPVIVQHFATEQVLMLGFMDEAAYAKTVADGYITFFSRTKNRLWTKGETSGNHLIVQSIHADCDQDTLLIKAAPQGPTCHTGQTSCFGTPNIKGTLYALETTIAQRIDSDDENSYTNKLFKKGINKIAQKVGEEAIELVIEAKDSNDDLFANEAADLLYHFLILLKAKNMKLEDIEGILKGREGVAS